MNSSIAAKKTTAMAMATMSMQRLCANRHEDRVQKRPVAIKIA